MDNGYYGEYAIIKKSAIRKWGTQTSAVGFVARAGRYGNCFHFGNSSENKRQEIVEN